MSFFGFGRDNPRTREHRTFGAPLTKKTYWEQAGHPAKSHRTHSFDRTPRPDHRQQTPRTTNSSRRNDDRRRGMGGRKLY